jgi:hypothetical protein
MKLLLFLIVWSGSLFAYGEDDLLRMDSVSDAVNTLLNEKQNDQKYRLDNLKELHHALAGNRPNIWAMPPRMLSEIRNAVEPARPIASQLALSENKHERFYGAVLNSYLAPTPESKNLLLKLANDDDGPTAGTALDTLFGMKWESQELRDKVIASLENTELDNKSILAGLTMNNAGDWGLVEAIPGLIRILEKDYSERGRLNSAVVQLKKLGTNAAVALPTLRKILESERLKKDPEFRKVEALEQAVLVISGSYKAPKPREEALPDTSEQSSQDAVRLERRKQKATSVSDESSDPKQSSQTRLWLIAGSIAILVLALVAWLKARKSNSAPNKHSP